MLSGVELGFFDSLVIALTGLAIVALELVFLMFFIIILSKVVSGLSNKKKDNIPAPAVPAGAPDIGLTDDEAAAVLTCVCEESGCRPEEIQIQSVSQGNLKEEREGILCYTE